MNTAKEVDKNNDQKKIDDNNSPDKPDNKRRDSVTGSVLDTGSSSNSSVDSDDLELLDSCCETKATMASSVSLDTSASNANKELNSEHNAMDGYSEDVMQKPRIDENPDQNGKSLNATAADEGDHANMGRAHRRATKKQFRRERRQKEKEKRSGENQFQQAQERAMRHRLEKASVVQNLLNLRVAENQPVVQKRSQQSVPVSFGDFPEQNHARSQPQSGGFAAFSDMNPSREKELVQMYTTGNKLHGELNSEHNAMDGYSEDVMQKPRIDENPDQNGKSLNATAADEGDHANMGRAHRRATKKQFRRERRQKEKEKRSGENQFQQAQERAMRHRLEKASVVQNLLNLRVAENQPVVQVNKSVRSL
ncbi:hypothetical protein Tcan_04808 [Toxocara canis]|uniref:Uncharacterized protein n=1 Tax=Toxocara canis TaxID=6265 RepID=A0A0B2W341_TOXCA|nr:hypothetical protein Tcan_04808 [Toxocara canis]